MYSLRVISASGRAAWVQYSAFPSGSVGLQHSFLPTWIIIIYFFCHPRIDFLVSLCLAIALSGFSWLGLALPFKAKWALLTGKWCIAKENINIGDSSIVYRRTREDIQYKNKTMWRVVEERQIIPLHTRPISEWFIYINITTNVLEPIKWRSNRERF